MTDSFCPVSLGDWIAACQRAHIPYVDAVQIAEVRKDDYFRWDVTDSHPDIEERLRAVYQAVKASEKPDHMVRWDCCTSLDVKHELANGRYEWCELFGNLLFDDPRALDIISEYPRNMIPIWQRPWARAGIWADYPVEYRAFVRDGEVVGISSYYPQRSLREDAEELRIVDYLTRSLIGVVEPPFEWPQGYMAMISDLNRSGVHFTADFIVTLDRGVLFLEGGPPHEMGAHPCCFRPNEIDGIALTNRNG